jgi:hypothetical protein
MGGWGTALSCTFITGVHLHVMGLWHGENLESVSGKFVPELTYLLLSSQ